MYGQANTNCQFQTIRHISNENCAVNDDRKKMKNCELCEKQSNIHV